MDSKFFRFFSSSAFVPLAALVQGCPSMLLLGFKNVLTAELTASAHHKLRDATRSLTQLRSLGQLPWHTQTTTEQNCSTNSQKP